MQGMSLLNVINIDTNTLSSGKLSENDLAMMNGSDIKYIVSLTDDVTLDSGKEECVVVEEMGLVHYSIPVDFWQPQVKDFIAFCDVYSKIYDERKIVHCDLNYRATFFIAYYNILFLGWDKEQADALISRVWEPREFGAWHQLSKDLLVFIKEQHEGKKREEKTASVVAAIRGTSMMSGDSVYCREREAMLKQNLTWWVMHNKPIEFILPGFPLKSPNRKDNVIGHLPDQGEYLALSNLNSFCSSIADVYEPGATINLFSDCGTFFDIFNVPEDVGREYNKRLRQLNVWPHIKWHSYASIHKKSGYPDVSGMGVADILRMYREKAKPGAGKKPKKQDVQSMHDMLSLEFFSKKGPLTTEQQDTVSCVAETMFNRGIGLSEMINHHFAKNIRLTIHSSLSGEKLPITLFSDEKNKEKLPWRHTPLLRQNGRWELLAKRNIEEEYNTMTIKNKEENWGLIELPNGASQEYEAQVIHEGRFGVLLTALNAEHDKNCLDLPVQLIENLIHNYGFVVVRGAGVKDEDNLLHFTEKFGQPYIWQFGPVHKVKPHDKPDGFVHSLEGIPLHWDLSMLPLDNPLVAKDPHFTAKSFVLYCKKAPLAGEGQTTLVDARNILATLDGATRKEWEQLVLSYDTPFTYFGGQAREYPLVTKHPTTGEKVLRYQEASDSELQKFITKVTHVGPDSAGIIKKINDLAYDESNIVEHVWRDGDIVIIDNYNVLHGRRPMSENSLSRELWRIQTY